MSPQRRRTAGGIRGGQLVLLFLVLGFILFLGLGEPLHMFDAILELAGFH